MVAAVAPVRNDLLVKLPMCLSFAICVQQAYACVVPRWPMRDVGVDSENTTQSDADQPMKIWSPHRKGGWLLTLGFLTISDVSEFPLMSIVYRLQSPA